MKTILLAIAATTISAVAVTNSNAQVAVNASVSNNDQPAVVNNASTSSTSESINLKAVKDFKKSFAGAKNESWEKIKDGYIAMFSQGSVQTTVGYNAKGKWMYNILRYDESKLPRDVRAQVKSTYYDCTITQVDEIHYQDKVTYLVHMQDANTWKIIRVCDGDMDVYQDFDKAK